MGVVEAGSRIAGEECLCRLPGGEITREPASQNGASDRNRTDDRRFTKPLLYL